MTEFEKIKHKVKIKCGIIPLDPLKARMYELLRNKDGNFTLIRYYIFVIMSVFLTNYFSPKDRHSLFLNFKATFVLTLSRLGMVNLKGK